MKKIVLSSILFAFLLSLSLPTMFSCKPKKELGELKFGFFLPPKHSQFPVVDSWCKKISKETRQEPRAPKVAHFHSSFVSSAVRWGRLNEIEFINFYEIKNALTDLKNLRFKSIFNEMISQGQIGLNMLRRKRLHFGFQSAKGRKEIKRLYKKAKTDQRG